MRKLSKIEEKVLEWNQKFPIDRWWREKHNIPYNSTAHREVSFLDQLFEYYEDSLYNEYKNSKEEEYEPNKGDFINIGKLDEKSQIELANEEFQRFLDGQED